MSRKQGVSQRPMKKEPPMVGSAPERPTETEREVVLDQRFLDQLKALEDIGYTLTKRENVRTQAEPEERCECIDPRVPEGIRAACPVHGIQAEPESNDARLGRLLRESVTPEAWGVLIAAVAAANDDVDGPLLARLQEIGRALAHEGDET